MSGSSTPKIFYVDDDKEDLEFVKDSFSRLNEDVDLATFQDSAEFADFLKNYPSNESVPCLFIVDLNMPKYKGWQLVEIIKTIEVFKDVPIVIFTTSSSIPDQHFATKYDIGFVTKPIDATQMGLIIDKFLHYCSESVKSHFQKY